MQIIVKLNNLRVAPLKSRQVVDLIRGKDINKARALLDFTVKRSAEPILKLLNSAVASATNNFKLEESNLYISKVMVDEGPKLKRSFPMSRGRAYPIMKRTSHITLVLSERNVVKEPKEKENKKIKTEKPELKAEIKKSAVKAKKKK